MRKPPGNPVRWGVHRLANKSPTGTYGSLTAARGTGTVKREDMRTIADVDAGHVPSLPLTGERAVPGVPQGSYQLAQDVAVHQ